MESKIQIRTIGSIIEVMPYQVMTEEWMPCVGGNLSKWQYKELYALIGDTYNENDTPKGYFGIPNFNYCHPLNSIRYYIKVKDLK